MTAGLGVMDLQVIGVQAGVLRDSRKHSWTDSSPSWKAKTKSGHPVRLNVRCDPDCRLTTHPNPSNSASTRRALVEGQ